ncbi:MAG TPA: ribosomal-processing cysteine protease Prp [Candidatus Baltobacteraceae bacterium]|jgi:hypothetical protein
MLEVTFCRDSHDRLSSLFATGHADAAEPGEDVVCAAVSAILQAARLGLEAHARIQLEVVQRAGDMSLQWPQAARDDASVQAIVATAELAIRQIAKQYPAHVRALTRSQT